MADEREAQEQAQAAGETLEVNEFESLLKKEFKPRTTQKREEIKNAVKTLAENVMEYSSVVSEDAVGSIEALIAEIDQKLTEQVNLIMHHEDFQKLEGAWRGLHHLVNNTETDEMLKIRVLNITKKDLHKTLNKFKGTAMGPSNVALTIVEAVVLKLIEPPPNRTRPTSTPLT